MYILECIKYKHKLLVTSRLFQQVVHDCRCISDLLFNRYGVGFVNIFDTQVASVILYQKDCGRLPKSVDSLVICIMKNLNLPDEVIYTQKALANRFKVINNGFYFTALYYTSI